MCFSAQASFSAAILLTIIGLLARREAYNEAMRSLANVPLFFAVQQACEGIVWITLQNNDNLSIMHYLGMYGFLFFAYLYWPMTLPLIMFFNERVRLKKIILLILSFLWAPFFVILVIYVREFNITNITATIVDHHIVYTIPLPTIPYIIGLGLYYCVAVIPFFISSVTHMWIVGTIITLGLIVSYIFFNIALTSVWCFFAAITSLAIYWVIIQEQKAFALQ